MSYELLSRLYCACTDDSGSRSVLSDLYAPIDEAVAADLAFGERLEQLLPMNDQDELIRLEISACQAYEKQGFINGVRLGLKLAREVSR